MAENEASVALVVVTHDSAAWLPEFVESWRTSVRGSPALRARGCGIVLADSGSSDGTVEAARGLWPEARILECGDVGFGAAANKGMTAAGSTWALLCNPDLVFPEAFARLMIDPILAAEKSAERSSENRCLSSFCVAPRLVNPEGTEQASVGVFPTIGSVVRDQFRPREMRKYVHPQPRQSQEVDWATGACLLLNCAAFKAIGGFDEKYFLYVEEVDLQRRLGTRGARTWFAHEATVVHHAPNAARAPRESVQRWSALGMLRYFARHGSMLDLLGYKVMALAAGRLTWREALRGRATILSRSTRS